MRRAAIVLLVLPVLAAAGCGGGDSSSSSGSSGSSGGSGYGGGYKSSNSSSGSGGGGTTVEMKNIAFSPRKLSVKVGDTVTWRNADSADHNVTADSGATFRSETFGNGGTFTYKTTEAGTIKYECTLHPGMTGELDVTS
jgi:plastocyanin